MVIVKYNKSEESDYPRTSEYKCVNLTFLLWREVIYMDFYLIRILIALHILSY